MNPMNSGGLQHQTNTRLSRLAEVILEDDKKSLKELCESERYRLLAENTTDVIFVQDMEFNLVYVSPSVTPLTGYEVEELLNLKVNDFMTSESFERATGAFQYYAALAREGDPDIPLMEYEYIRKDGSTFWGELKVTFLKDPKNNLIGTLGTLRDITQRKETERKLKESEKQKSLILNNISEHLVYQDKSHRIIWANEAAAESVGKRPEDLEGLYCYYIWNQDSKPCTSCPVEWALKTGKPQKWEVRSSDGRVWMIKGSPVVDDGNEMSAIEIAMDITEHKKNEQRIVHLNEALRLLNKTLRHEILNDLNVVGNSIEMYQDIKNEKLLNNALNSVDKSIKLIKEMKSLESLVSTGESLKPYSVKEIVEHIGEGYHIDFNAEGDCKILADEAFSSIIDNIIRNAVEHGAADKVDVITKERGGLCEIQISDNGTGIHEEIKDRIFEEGFSGDGKGTGLGLFIAQKTIKRYGGHIQVKDNQPAGSIFILSLSCTESEQPKGA